MTLYVRTPWLSVNFGTDVARFGTRDARRQFRDCPGHSRTVGNPTPTSVLPFCQYCDQRWSPRGHILKSLALASKVKFLVLVLASRPQVLENRPVLGSRTAVFFELLKFCEALENFFGKRFFVEIAWKIFVKTFFFFFFWEHLRLCPWSLALASSIPVLGLESVCPRKGCPWPWPRIFLCPWPWPRALCPRLHLWLWQKINFLQVGLNLYKKQLIYIFWPFVLFWPRQKHLRSVRTYYTVTVVVLGNGWGGSIN